MKDHNSARFITQCLLLMGILFIASCSAETPALDPLATAAPTTGSPSSSYNLANDEGIAAAYQEITGVAVDLEEACLKPVPNFESVALIGYFVHDLGCIYNDAIVVDEAADIRGVTARALFINGWSDEALREELALNWVKGALLATHQFPNASNEDFWRDDTPAYSEPTSTLLEDGGVRVALWAEEPAGDQPIAEYGFYIARFGADGIVQSTQFSDRFEVNLSDSD